MKYSKKMFIKEGQALKLNDTQTVLEISNETNKGNVEKDLKIDFESFKTLYKGKIDDKCIADYNTIDDKTLWEDTAKEMFLKTLNYIPDEDTKVSGDLVKKENKRIIQHSRVPLTETKLVENETDDVAEYKEFLSLGNDVYAAFEMAKFSDDVLIVKSAQELINNLTAVQKEFVRYLMETSQYNARWDNIQEYLDKSSSDYLMAYANGYVDKYQPNTKNPTLFKYFAIFLWEFIGTLNGVKADYDARVYENEPDEDDMVVENRRFIKHDIKTENAKYSKRTLIKESVSKDIPAIDNLNKSLVTKMLDTFDSNGRYAHRGNWSIANGGYDLYWEIYYDGLPVIRDIGGNVSEELNGWENWAKFVADYYKETYSSELRESKKDKAQQKEECNNTKQLNEAIEVHQELNPKIWNTDNTIKEEVATKLKDIANEFIKYIEIPLNIVDIEIVGSNASYNYNENSDLDLHIIVNSEVNYVEPTILRQLYNSKKNSFNDNYDLSVNDIPIELYIEDVKDGNATNGRYSLLKDEWVVFPEPITYEIPDISEQLTEYENKCNEALNSTDGNAILELVNDIYMMRKIGLAADGEASVGNLVFKELRNQDMLQKLKDRYYEIKSTELSE